MFRERRVSRKNSECNLCINFFLIARKYHIVQKGIYKKNILLKNPNYEKIFPVHQD